MSRNHLIEQIELVTMFRDALAEVEKRPIHSEARVMAEMLWRVADLMLEKMQEREAAVYGPSESLRSSPL